MNRNAINIFPEKAEAQETFQVLDIIRGTTVDGPGFRTSIYLAGCSHSCPGCHNPQSWCPTAGRTMTLSEIMAIVEEEDFDVTLTGGDPLFYPEKAVKLAKAITDAGYKVWLYTGYTLEEIRNSEKMSPVLEYVDSLVDGPFKQDEYDSDLLFRGSKNQRIIKISILSSAS